MSVIEREKGEMTKTEKNEEEKQPKVKYRIRPTRYINYDVSENKWELEFHLPGVNKKNINLRFLKDAYALEAKRGEAVYHASEYLPFDIDQNSIEADYNNGLLYVSGKIRDPMDDAFEIKLE